MYETRIKSILCKQQTRVEVKFGVLTAAMWDVMLCILVGRYQCFGGTCFLHVWGRKFEAGR
jgi:hypothetical protein